MVGLCSACSVLRSFSDDLKRHRCLAESWRILAEGASMPAAKDALLESLSV
jgi:hypothetical protein